MIEIINEECVRSAVCIDYKEKNYFDPIIKIFVVQFVWLLKKIDHNQFNAVWFGSIFEYQNYNFVKKKKIQNNILTTQ